MGISLERPKKWAEFSLDRAPLIPAGLDSRSTRHLAKIVEAAEGLPHRARRFHKLCDIFTGSGSYVLHDCR